MLLKTDVHFQNQSINQQLWWHVSKNWHKSVKINEGINSVPLNSTLFSLWGVKDVYKIVQSSKCWFNWEPKRKCKHFYLKASFVLYTRKVFLLCIWVSEWVSEWVVKQASVYMSMHVCMHLCVRACMCAYTHILFIHVWVMYFAIINPVIIHKCHYVSTFSDLRTHPVMCLT